MLNNIQNLQGFALVDILTDIQNSLIKEAMRQAFRAYLLGDSHQMGNFDAVPDGALELIPETAEAETASQSGSIADCEAPAL
jgi:hypothetical protein